MAYNTTEVRLLAVPLENDYKHTLYFSSLDEQTTYFKSKTVHTATNVSYQRKDRFIAFPNDYDSLQNCNYIMYRNTAFSNKWYYAFITKMEYKNNETTWIYFDIDVIQTWYFDYTIKPSFIEREHTNDDTPGNNVVPENLELGEYVVNNVRHADSLKECGVIVATTINLRDISPDIEKLGAVAGNVYGGIYSGLQYFYFPLEYGDNGESIIGVDALMRVLRIVATLGQSDGIVSLFIAPRNYIGQTLICIQDIGDGSLSCRFEAIVRNENPITKEWDINSSGDTNISKVVDFEGYQPTNQKLLTFPYCYLLMSNNSGGSAVYHYEYFNRGNPTAKQCQFYIQFVPSPGGSLRVVPIYYKNTLGGNFEEGLSGGKFPICSWNSDVYTNWLTQNAMNNAISYVSGGLQIAGGVAMTLGTGGVGMALGGGSIVGGISTIANTMAETHKASLTPPQSEGNTNIGDVVFANGNLKFSAYGMTITKEYAQMIDNYFNVFAYKTNLVKVPNKNHRENYWFTKTIDISIDGVSIPNEDMQKIKDCYNNGITFWKNPANIGDYSVSNAIV